MKKTGFLLFFALLFVSMAICIYAETITTQTNFSESTAPTLKMGDTAVVTSDFGSYGYNDNRKYKYYKFDVDYVGTLRVDTKIVSTEYSYNPVIYSFTIKNSEFSTGELKYSYSTNKNATINSYFEVSVLPGTYYIAITEGNWLSLNYSLISKAQTLYLSLSFECSHISTNTEITEQPTCSQEGTEITKCNDCKKTVSTKSLSKLPHTDGTEWKVLSEASCSKKGEKVLYCSVCDEVSRSENIEKFPHSYSDWTLNKEATCSEKGSKSRVCSVCSFEETVDIEKEEHDWGKWNVEENATEFSTGSRFRVCSECDYIESQVVPKLVHGEDYEWSVEKEATCTTDGYMKKICLYCDRSIETKTCYDTIDG